MKRAALFILSLGVAFAAIAQQAPAPADPASPAPASGVAPDGKADNESDSKAKDSWDDRNCLKETGSRVIRADRKGRKCAIAAGRAYNREDIERTGATDLKDALRRLDPTVH